MIVWHILMMPLGLMKLLLALRAAALTVARPLWQSSLVSSYLHERYLSMHMTYILTRFACMASFSFRMFRSLLLGVMLFLGFLFAYLSLLFLICGVKFYSVKCFRFMRRRPNIGRRWPSKMAKHQAVRRSGGQAGSQAQALTNLRSLSSLTSFAGKFFVAQLWVREAAG